MNTIWDEIIKSVQKIRFLSFSIVLQADWIKLGMTVGKIDYAKS